MSAMTPESYVLVQALFTPVFLLWGFLWLLVAANYGQSSYAGWVASGGRWRDAIPDILSPILWGLKASLCRWGLLRGDTCAATSVPHSYEPGNILRFAIFLGSLTPISFGFQFAELDRHDWTLGHIVTTLIFALTSILAAQIHLYLAYRSYPEAWRKLVTRTTLWLLITPPLFYVLYSVRPEGLPLF